MLKIMIAEDEALERKALRFLLEKYYKQDIEIVAEVTNGKDAVDKAIAYKPDIVLMDIHMPIMDGLEASTIIKSYCKDTEFIILTAYNYFEYAKKSIEIGVSDYLLKPFSNEDFFKSVKKLMDKINKKLSDEDKTKKLSQNYKKVIPYLEKELITSIVYGLPVTEMKFSEYKDILDIKDKKFCSIVIHTGNESNIDEAIVSMIKNKLKITFDEVIGCLCLNDIVLFIFDEELDSKILSKRFEDILNNLQRDIYPNNEVIFNFGIGHTYEGADKLYVSYKDAKLSAESKIEKESSYDNESAVTVHFKTGLSEMEIELSGKIINEDLDGALREFDNAISNLLDSGEVADFETIRTKLLELFSTVLRHIDEFVGEDSKGLNKDALLEELVNLKELPDLKYLGNMIIKNIINYISNYKRSKNIDVVEKVKRYIESNYMKDVTLDELAQYVSLSSFYLSRTFTRIEGMTFREYLTKIRMEKAKSLLREGNMSVKQIALEVGYVDQNYFSKAFKKYTNMSPKEYCRL